jgi:uncharacterized protein (TIGR04551 family)
MVASIRTFALGVALAVVAFSASAHAQTSDPAPKPAEPPQTAPPPGDSTIPQGGDTGIAPPPAVDATPPTTIPPPPGAPGSDISLDDWDRDDWTLVKPSVQLFELHGYFRVRGDLMRRLDWGNRAGTEIPTNGTGGASSALVSRYAPTSHDKAQVTDTNMRARFEPTINVSERVSLISMLDVLDNVGFGTNPATYPFDSTGANANATPLNILNDRQLSPVTNVNAVVDSVRIKRLYARITALNEQLEVKIGRMPNQWGLGMQYNGGDCLDCDFGMNVDRIQATIRLGGLLITPMLDWVSSGPVITPFGRYDGPQLDAVTWDDVPEYAVRLQKLTHPDDIREEIAQGHNVLDFGVHNSFRRQSADLVPGYYGTTFDPAAAVRQDTDIVDPTNTSFSARENRHAFLYSGNAYMKVYTPRLEFDWEAAVRAGSFRDTLETGDQQNPTKNTIRQWATAFELSWWPDDRRRGPRLMLKGGAASGDSAPGWGALDKAGTQRGTVRGSYDRTLNNFNFSPDYHVDLLLFRRIVGTVTDAWYVAPEARYFFNDAVEGRLRIEYAQTFFKSTSPGNALPMGLEVDGEIHLGAPPEGEQAGLRGALFGAVAFPFGAFRNGENGVAGKFAWTLQYRLYVTF